MLDVNFMAKGYLTPFWCAAEYENKEIMELLLETKKVDIDSEDAYGRIPPQ
jgi:ankyrin repeat protein